MGLRMLDNNGLHKLTRYRPLLPDLEPKRQLEVEDDAIGGNRIETFRVHRSAILEVMSVPSVIYFSCCDRSIYNRFQPSVVIGRLII